MTTIFHRGKTLGVGLSREILVIAHPASAPSREDWDYVVQAIRTQHRTARGELVVSRGGGPDAAQRKRAFMELPEGFAMPPVAVISDSIAVRGIITALNWLLDDTHRAFAPRDVAGVASHLRIREDEAVELIAFAETLIPSPPG